MHTEAPIVSSSYIWDQKKELLDTFPEMTDVLRRLKLGGIRAAILPNGPPIMLTSFLKQARLGVLLDCILSVEEIGVYKLTSSLFLQPYLLGRSRPLSTKAMRFGGVSVSWFKIS